jgi:hypothetical protein
MRDTLGRYSSNTATPTKESLMSESIATQVKDGLADVAKTPKKIISAPIVAFVVGFVFLTVVLFIEAYKPNTITRLPRWLLTKLGVKTS